MHMAELWFEIGLKIIINPNFCEDNCILNGGRHGCDRMVFGFTYTCAISAYHN